MNHPQFEAVKVAIKQDKTGYILTLNIHPDDIDERILRDFVGARYQLVMVRLNSEERPMNREADLGPDPVKLAGMLCRDPKFHLYLVERGHVFEESEEDATGWLKADLVISSRSELRDNPKAVKRLMAINEDYKAWKQNA